MTTAQCSTCFTELARYECANCQTPICKDCARSIGEERLKFMRLRPVPRGAETPKLEGVFCNPCFNTTLADLVDAHEALLERAGQVLIFTKDQGKETRLIKRSERPLKIEDAEDRDETILMLAYLAANAGHNCLVDVETTYEKRRDGSYKLAKWSGTAIPVTVDLKRYDR